MYLNKIIYLGAKSELVTFVGAGVPNPKFIECVWLRDLLFTGIRFKNIFCSLF